MRGAVLIQEVRKAYGHVVAVDGVSLEVAVTGRGEGHVTLRTAGGTILPAAGDDGYTPGARACIGIRPEPASTP